MQGMTAEELKALRKDAGWAQERLARELEVGLSTVSRWEQGQRTITRPMARLIRIVLDEN